ncbi:hypothetical protein A7982_13910 [Minicystis rosea]|nr:hypothetical protein A7982_13910 [Minicystis rosea]
MRSALRFCFALAAVLAAPSARADSVDACVSAADEGQMLRDRGKLLAARERFAACAAQACPRLVRTDCAGWLAAVEAQIPSVILSAVDGDGRPIADVHVSIDGGPTEPLAGQARRLDPGAHRLRFFARGWQGAALDQTLVLHERERAQTHIVRLLPPRPPPPAPATLGHGARTASIILGGVAVVGGGVFAGLAWDAKHEADRLRATCAPRCDPADVDAVRAKGIGANVALALGATSAVAMGVLLLVRPGRAAAVSRGEPGVLFRF